MTRYIAIQPILFGNALAFPAGHQVPADHVSRYGYDTAGWVMEVGDDVRGDAPDLVPAAPDTAPPSLAPPHYVDAATAAVVEAQRAAAGAPAAEDLPAAPTAAKQQRSKPATGATTTDQPVTED